MKFWIRAGLCCLTVGVLCCTAAVALGAGKQHRWQDALNLTDETLYPSQSFSAILIDVDRANVTIKSGDTASVIARNVPEDFYSAAVREDVLEVREDRGASNDWLSIFQFWPVYEAPAEITVTLPAGHYSAFAIALDLGDFVIQDCAVNTLSVDADCGNCRIENVTTASLTATCDLGDLSVTDTAVDGTAMLDNSCGNTTLERVDIGALCNISAAWGDITLSAVTADTNTLTLDGGSLTMTDCRETGNGKNGSIESDLGDCVLRGCTLYDTQFSLDCGDLKVTDTALYGITDITADLGDIDLTLRGSAEEYTVSTIAGTSRSKSDNFIRIDADETMASVSVDFTD